MTPDGPDSKAGDPFAPDLLPDQSLEGRLRALGLGDRESDTGATAAPGAASGHGPDQEVAPDPRLAAIGAQLKTLSSGLAAHRVQLRDAERSLVDRIADVDDDRRRAQSQAQRALQTHRDELEARLHRHGWLTALALLLIGGLAGAGLSLIDHRLTAAQAPLATQIANLHDEVAQLAGVESQGRLVQHKIDSLSAAVAALSSALREVADQREQASTAAPVAAAGAPALLEQIGRLGAEEQRLHAELEALRGTDAAAAGPSETAPGASPEPAEAETAPGATQETAPEAPQEVPDQAPEAADEPAATGAEAATAVAPPPDTPADTPAETPTTAPAQSTAGPAADADTEVTADRPFALQLIGFYSYDKLREFAMHPGLPPKVYLRRETLRGRPWFVLIHSLHASEADAQAALAQLPTDLVDMEPWIRKLPTGAGLMPIPTGPTP